MLSVGTTHRIVGQEHPPDLPYGDVIATGTLEPGEGGAQYLRHNGEIYNVGNLVTKDGKRLPASWSPDTVHIAGNDDVILSVYANDGTMGTPAKYHNTYVTHHPVTGRKVFSQLELNKTAELLERHKHADLAMKLRLFFKANEKLHDGLLGLRMKAEKAEKVAKNTKHSVNAAIDRNDTVAIATAERDVERNIDNVADIMQQLDDLGLDYDEAPLPPAPKRSSFNWWSKTEEPEEELVEEETEDEEGDRFGAPGGEEEDIYEDDELQEEAEFEEEDDEPERVVELEEEQ
jgi:hypothetical protein